MKLQEQIQRIQEMMGLLNEAYDPELVRDKYVPEVVSEEQFNQLKVVFGNYQEMIWILKKIEMGCFSFDTVYKIKSMKYFDIFKKRKKEYPIKDLGQIKTCEQTNEFLNICEELSEKNTKEEKLFIKFSDIEKLENNFIQYMGIHEGFQVFVIPHINEYFVKSVKLITQKYDFNNIYESYKDILGDCENRSKTNKVNFCTVGSQHHFRKYVKQGELVIFHQKNNPESPIQIFPLTKECKNFSSKESTFCNTLIPIADDLVLRANQEFRNRIDEILRHKNEEIKKQRELNNLNQNVVVNSTPNTTMTKEQEEELEKKYLFNIVNIPQFNQLKNIFRDYSELSWILKKIELGCFNYEESLNFPRYFEILKERWLYNLQYPFNSLEDIKYCDDVHLFVKKTKEILNT